MKTAKIFLILLLSLSETTDALSERKKLSSSLPLNPPRYTYLFSYSLPYSPTLSKRKTHISSSLPLAVIHEDETLEEAEEFSHADINRRKIERSSSLPEGATHEYNEKDQKNETLSGTHSPTQEILFTKENVRFKKKLKIQALDFAHENASIASFNEALSLDSQYTLLPYNGSHIFPVPILGIYTNAINIVSTPLVKIKKQG